MSILYTMVGLPASGKSTFCDLMSSSAVVVSTDAIRAELYGNASIQGNAKRVFSIAHTRIADALADGKDVIFDATNVDTKSRKAVFMHTATHIAVYCTTPKDVCIARNALRSRVVPVAVIERMATRLTAPTHAEGFNAILTIRAK